MPAHPPITRQSYGRTFTVAGAALGAIAVLQMAAAAWRVFQDAPVSVADSPSTPLPKIDIQKLTAEYPPPEEPPLAVKDPLENDPVVIDEQGVRPVPVKPEAAVATPVKPESPPEARATGPAVAMPFVNGRPTPVPLEQFTPKVAPEYNELIEQGKLYRNRGDTAKAREKFGQAANLDPSNALALAELAYTFEKMSLPDKAAEQWRRVLALGENGGALYAAARAKLDMAIATVVRPSNPSNPANPASLTGSDANVSEGRILGLGSPVITQEPPRDSEKRFTLRLPIVARSGTTVDRGDVKILVLFYDQVNGRELDKNTAHVSNAWVSPPADWSEEQTETLEVSYDMPKSPSSERRAYYGYVARLYYKGELQATHAEPAVLNQKFPAPTTLSE